MRKTVPVIDHVYVPAQEQSTDSHVAPGARVSGLFPVQQWAAMSRQILQCDAC